MNDSNIDIGDIDLDCRNRNDIIRFLEYVPAKKTDGTRHATGVYIQDIPVDALTGLAEVFYDESEFTKIDFLNLSTLTYFSSNEEIEELMSKEPNWDLLKIKEIVNILPQIHDHYELVQKMNPRSVEDLVDVLNKIREHSVYRFKRSHAVAYSLNIVALLNYFEKTDTLPTV